MARRAALIRLVIVDSETIRPAPDRRKQIVLADDSIAIADQERQQIRIPEARRLIAAPAWVTGRFEAHCQQGRHAQVPL